MTKIIFLLAAVLTIAGAHKYCKNDVDCDSLGPDLNCIKSMCNWGICGCPRDQAMRYLGSERLFRCVHIRKIGESCSEDGDAGLCGAADSECLENVCKCNNGFKSVWGGENCLPAKRSFVGESCSELSGQLDNTCSRGEGGTGTCTVGTAWNGPGLQGVDHPLDYVPNTCKCADGFQTALPNSWEDAPYMGRKDPHCVAIKVGEPCLRDADCVSITGNGAVCTADVCTCSSGVVDITGLKCGAGLGYGATCTDNTATASLCDGTQGLRCGNVCNMDTYAAGVAGTGGAVLTCACDPGWSDSGSSCTAVGAGAACNGDYNCKSLGMNAICTDGTCQNGGLRAAVSFLVMLLPLLGLLLN